MSSRSIGSLKCDDEDDAASTKVSDFEETTILSKSTTGVSNENSRALLHFNETIIGSICADMLSRGRSLTTADVKHVNTGAGDK